VREKVLLFSGILRVSDGLYYSHKNRVRDIKASYTKKSIQFDCLAKKISVKKEIPSAEKKGDLLRLLYKRDLVFIVLSIEKFIGWS